MIFFISYQSSGSRLSCIQRPTLHSHDFSYIIYIVITLVMLITQSFKYHERQQKTLCHPYPEETWQIERNSNSKVCAING